nr:phosphatidylinositol-specific phospholipase C [uncultured Flavobacterium sp.]
MKNYVQRVTILLFAFGFLFVSCESNLADDLQANEAVKSTSKNDVKQLTSKTATYTMSNWMGALDQNLKLTAISIPGTHDSGARFETFSGTAKCQNLTLDEQLASGVRYLDIRCRHFENNFTIHHGSVYQNLNFTNVLQSCSAFLAQNPSETIIMSVKEEYDPSGNNRSFEATFDSYVNQNANIWYLGSTIPTLSQAKGKIVLLRRFSTNNTKGVDASSWGDNTVFDISGVQPIKVQDQYKVPNNDTKFNLIKGLAEEAKNAASNNNKLYLNYCSGYKAGLFGIPNINTVANAINPKLTSFFQTNTKGRFGVIIMDFAVTNRNSLIVQTNF